MESVLDQNSIQNGMFQKCDKVLKRWQNKLSPLRDISMVELKKKIWLAKESNYKKKHLNQI